MSLKQGKNSTVSPGPQQIQVQAQSGGPNSRTLRGGPPPRPEDYHQPRAIPAYTHPGSAAQQQGIPLQQGRHPHTAPSPHDMNKGGVSSQGPPPVVGTPPTGPSPGPQMSQPTQMYASVSMSQGHRSSQAYPQPTLFIPQQYRPQAIPNFQPPQPTIQSATAYFQPAPQGPGPGGTQTTYRTGEQLQCRWGSYGYAPQAQPMQTTQQQRPPSMPTGQITMIQQPPQPPQQQSQRPQKRERKIVKITDNTGRDVTQEILSD